MKSNLGTGIIIMLIVSAMLVGVYLFSPPGGNGKKSPSLDFIRVYKQCQMVKASKMAAMVARDFPGKKVVVLLPRSEDAEWGQEALESYEQFKMAIGDKVSLVEAVVVMDERPPKPPMGGGPAIIEKFLSGKNVADALKDKEMELVVSFAGLPLPEDGLDAIKGIGAPVVVVYGPVVGVEPLIADGVVVAVIGDSKLKYEKLTMSQDVDKVFDQRWVIVTKDNLEDVKNKGLKLGD